MSFDEDQQYGDVLRGHGDAHFSLHESQKTISNGDSLHEPRTLDNDPTTVDYGKKVAVYGSSAALTFFTTSSTNDFETVSIDGAASFQGLRKYNWKDKITVMITRQELPIVAAVMLGIIPKCSFSNHGHSNDKGYSVITQPDSGNILFSMTQKSKKKINVPIGQSDVFYVAGLIISQIVKQQPWLSPQEAMVLLKTTVGRLYRMTKDGQHE